MYHIPVLCLAVHRVITTHGDSGIWSAMNFCVINTLTTLTAPCKSWIRSSTSCQPRKRTLAANMKTTSSLCLSAAISSLSSTFIRTRALLTILLASMHQGSILLASILISVSFRENMWDSCVAVILGMLLTRVPSLHCCFVR